MSIHRDKARGRYRFEFDRVVGGKRLRVTKLLPATWSRAQADAFDRQESARLYATATGIERPQHLIEEAVACYLKERAPQLKQGGNVTRELALMFWVYKGRHITELADVCKAYREHGLKEDGKTPLSPASIRNRLRYLVAACRWGWKVHNMTEHDPAARVVMPTVSNERQVYIDRAQMLAIARACRNRMARMAIRIAFYSGMRLSEILRAVPRGECWHLADTKNGQPRIVPIHPKVAVCARRLEPGPKITVQSNFRKAAAEVGMAGMHFHDLRHSAASAMINAGVDLYSVGAVLGHKDSRSTKRYSHLNTEALMGAVGRIGRKSPQAGQKKRA